MIRCRSPRPAAGKQLAGMTAMKFAVCPVGMRGSSLGVWAVSNTTELTVSVPVPVSVSVPLSEMRFTA